MGRTLGSLAHQQWVVGLQVNAAEHFGHCEVGGGGSSVGGVILLGLYRLVRADAAAAGAKTSAAAGCVAWVNIVVRMVACATILRFM